MDLHSWKHKSVTTTERYLGVKFEETREAIYVLDVPSLKALSAPVLSTNCVQLPKQPIDIPLTSIS
jgi:hypothetical protein